MLLLLLDIKYIVVIMKSIMKLYSLLYAVLKSVPGE